MKDSRISRWFPLPAFLSLRSGGISVGDESIACIEFEPSRFGTSIKKYCLEPLSFGAVENGHIIKQDEVARALGAIKEKYDVSFIRAAIPEELSFVVPLSVPLGDYQNIRQHIIDRADEYVPLQENDIVFDYSFSGKSKDGKHQNIVMSAVSQKVASSYAELFLRAGMTPVSFETDTQAVARAVVPDDEQGTVMCVDIRKKRTAIFIVTDGIVRFATSVEYGEEFFEERLSEYVDLSAKAVREIKKNRDVSMGFYKDAARKALRELAVELSLRIEELLAYWKTHQQAPAIPERIFVSGPFVAWKGVFEYIAEKMPMQSFRADPWVNVFFSSGSVPQVLSRDKFNYTTAIGLALLSLEDEANTI